MLPLNVSSFTKSLTSSLNSEVIGSRILLDKLSVIDESSRKTAAYLDPKFAPFYFYLGKLIKPKTVLELGFDLGLLSSCFLKSCKTVECFCGYKEKTEEYFSFRLGRANIKSNFKGVSTFYNGNLYDQEFVDVFSANSWDLVIINDEQSFDKHLEYLDYVWSQIPDYGIIVAEYVQRHRPSMEAFNVFCKSKSREPIYFKTRYGTKIVQK